MKTVASSADETSWPKAVDWVAPSIKPSSEWRLKDLDASNADQRRRRVRTTVWMEVESEKERAVAMVEAFHRGDWDTVFGDAPLVSPSPFFEVGYPPAVRETMERLGHPIVDEVIEIPNDVLEAMDAIAPRRAPHRSSRDG